MKESASKRFKLLSLPLLQEFYDYCISGILANFSDIQTVLLACISTLLPLIIALGIAFGVRYDNFTYCERNTPSAVHFLTRTANNKFF